MRSISVQGLRRLAARQGHSQMAFRRGRVARRRISMQEPKLTELGGNGVDLQIRSAQNPDFPPLDPNQTFMPNSRDLYVVVEDLDSGPWMTAGGLFVTVLQIEEDGTIVQEVPGDFALEYDEYLKTGEEPIGQGEDWARVLDYFNLDVAEIDRWKDEVLDSLKTGQLAPEGEDSGEEEVAVIVITRLSHGKSYMDPTMYVANMVGGTGLEYAITSEGMGVNASDALKQIADAWSRQGFLE
jgi:hypothetical protein